MGRLLLLYGDESLDDKALFGEIRQRAFSVMPKDTVRTTGQQLCEKPANQLTFRWQVPQLNNLEELYELPQAA